jgi:hypothetical protein
MEEGEGGPLGVVKAPVEFTRAYDGRADQIRDVRAFLAGILNGCPVADEAVLIADELASNAVRHSNSGKPGGRFTIRVEVHEPDYLWVEVEDEGSRPWTPRAPDGERWHGLSIVREIAGGDANWGIDGSMRGWVVWVRLDWITPRASVRNAKNNGTSRLCFTI